MMEYLVSSGWAFGLILMVFFLAIVAYIGFLITKNSCKFAWLNPWLILACGGLAFLGIWLMINYFKYITNF